MNTQPEALRLAEQLESEYDPVLHLVKPAAAELRRLQSVNQELVEALEWIVRVNAMDYEYKQKAKAALNKAQGESND